MSAREWLYRAWRSVDVLILQWHWRLGSGLCRRARYEREAFAFCRATNAMLNVPFRNERSAAEIDKLLSGFAPALSFPWQWKEASSAWHDAPDTGRRWPQTFFGRISYRPGNPHGDARIVWEPSRLQHLVSLALVAHEDGDGRDARAANCIEKQILSWLSANPPLTGIHYVSAMECALRLIAVCHALDLVRGRLSAGSPVWGLLPGFVRSHAGLIERRLSLYSSLGNHTVAECAGLIYAGYLFPEFAEAKRWRERGTSILTEAIAAQVLDDGGGVEQSFWYHAFVVDLAGLAGRLIRSRGDTPPVALTAAVKRGRAFLATFADHPQAVPDIGDRDGGYALSPELRLSWQQSAAQPRVSVFRASGYTRIALAADTTLVFDHGPLGMAPGYGHGHADALAVLLTVRGQPILADPGTYGYGLELDWRRYFRGTAAHNTVTVEDADQAVQEAAFQWAAPYEARLTRIEERDGRRILALACHNGYARLGVVHWRGIVADPHAGVTVLDCLMGRGEHTYAAHWHCPLRLQRADTANRILMKTPEREISLELEGGAILVREGALSPPAGWLAPQYGLKHPIATIRLEGRASFPKRLVSRIRLDGFFGPLAGEAEDLATLEQWIDHG
jgi:hypothetical protein